MVNTAPKERKTAFITGIGSFLDKLKEYKQIDYPKEQFEETPVLKQQREKREKQLLNKQKLDEDFAKWNPSEDPHIKGDPYKTLFVGRLNYEVTEIDLQKEFSKYGEVERVRVVRDKDTSKSKGYAFILFDHDSSAKAAYKEANGLKIKGRAIITDIERSRTFKSWVPRRLGGGLGGRGYIKRQIEAERAPKRRYDTGPPSGRGRGGSRFGTRGGPVGGGRGGRGGGYDRSRGGSSSRGGYDRSSYSSYDSRSSRYRERQTDDSSHSGDYGDRYESRSERPSGGITRYESRSERPERTERFEYSSRSNRDFSDRDRDRDRDSRVVSEREKEREKFRERKLEQASKSRMRY
ncbi:Polyadenylate-binding protein, cytoplasmic and nuclear [Wickerhamomyces ciferrii]|uniref:Polyadenylate-binding protein, cytoplasmic and nuclear n=1 Tax=Wickerhamomyces ciferrii (strain ATCC 14091 / BCRC 22168 / CBS 111 / JCM 3599 / NBRC 0793 / NRRL Y-1031 F-60-10) TaxID=1206466 RepID=K0KGR3_WICCF|nr:Polyadenylate-binding protein, cytoplasmic and nuclear [Wickerhamomyces ciferrii]CCH44355.1 Polyadenylate-binding protein, cytoplasmic and nuclear [Wickerhamomyces ciferrii]